MAAAIRAAADDARRRSGLVQEADLLACVDPIAWGYDDLTRFVGAHGGHDRSGVAASARRA